MRRTAGLAILAEVLRTKAWLPAVVLAVHLLFARVLHAYQAVPALDLAVHGLGGFAIGYVFDGVLQILGRQGDARLSGSGRLVLAFALVCTTTVLWELGEVLSDRILGTGALLSLENSLLDMLVGIVGGVGYVGWRVLAERS
ncbi:MAG TPA: hypothetical protein VMT85_13965 [Thermoanaerobaculia bacterium]|nr:hypothetical protein [Thermoanaerobaculia bacterium]